MVHAVTYGVSLSGGGARGIIQLGVLQALVEHEIVPSVVAGTSMGAINGVLYAAGYEPKEIAEILKKHVKTISFSFRNFFIFLLVNISYSFALFIAYEVEFNK